MPPDTPLPKLTPEQLAALTSTLSLRDRLRSLLAGLERCRDTPDHALHLSERIQASIGRTAIPELWHDPRDWAIIALDAIIADTDRRLRAVEDQLALYVETPR